jgi:hypothetical protein
MKQQPIKLAFKRDRKARKRYGTYYYHIVGDFTVKQDTSGSTDELVNAFANAASHCARSELQEDEYAQAIVFDRHAGRPVRLYKRGAGGNIVTKDFT